MSPIALKFSLPAQDLTQSKAPSFHSCTIPTSRIVKNKNSIANKRIDFPLIIYLKTGNSNAISTSKIKNSTTNKKKRVEKGDRIFLNGSNPHSKGVNFSLKSE